MRLSFVLLGLSLLLPAISPAKEKRPIKIEPLPGEFRSGPQGAWIALEGGKTLDWPNQGPLVLRGADGKSLYQVDLQGSVKRQSGAEAMGLEVEEVDLGGSRTEKKKYLSGKKAPAGRKLEAGALTAGPNTAEAGQVQKAVVGGVPITTTTYPNGSSLWHLEWPTYSEDIYFDKRKTMVSDLQSREQDGAKISLQQFSDGSYQRNYQKPGGMFRVTYDANDQSYRLSFANSRGDLLAELSCVTTCSED